MVVKNRLKELRENLGISSAELARMMGLSASTVNLQESCQRNITIDVALRYCREIFNCSLDYLFYNDTYEDVLKDYDTETLIKIMNILEKTIDARKEVK